MLKINFEFKDDWKGARKTQKRASLTRLESLKNMMKATALKKPSKIWQTTGARSKMLFLTRKLGEHLVINDDIKVYFMERRGNHITLGIDAPKSVPVHRPELGERTKDESK